MIINKLELCNFRKHRKLEVVLKPGVTGIVGDNGTGKSSIVEALQFALTGDLYHGKKSEAITVGEDSGYVRMLFTLNGKKGTLIRYLTSSAPELVYDGKVKKKAGEVKELWDTLLQVGPEIISKVIIARQGDIPLLFSGDQAIREKVFQKIFLVPPCEKLRSVILQKYMKQLPPLLPVEDSSAMKEQIAAIETKISKLKYDLNALNVLTVVQLEEKRDRLKFLLKCDQDVGASIILDNSIKTSQRAIEQLNNSIQELEAMLGSVQIEDYELQLNTQLQQKALFQQKLKLQNELKKLEAVVVDPAELTAANQDYLALAHSEEEHRTQMITLKVTIGNLDTQIERYKTLKDKSVCHACGQALHSVLDLLKVISQERDDAQAKYKIAKDLHTQSKQDMDAQKKYIDEVTELQKEKDRIAKQLEQFKDLEFDEGSLTMFKEVIAQYREYEDELTDLTITVNKEQNALKMTEQQRSALAKYDGKYASTNDERDVITDELNRHDEAYRLQQMYSSDMRMREYDLTQLKIRQAASKDNLEKNKKRNRYSEILSASYDALHTENFPRKLILNYADVVSEYLQEKLQGFNIPYTAKLAENFHIEMYNDANVRVPAVSGGQEIQVGISLHLALHELFSQSFPLLVIDEGTTHLDATNRKAYFDIIKKLKANDKLQQIIIIDHDPQLSEVVDNVISLGENA